MGAVCSKIFEDLGANKGIEGSVLAHWHTLHVIPSTIEITGIRLIEDTVRDPYVRNYLLS